MIHHKLKNININQKKLTFSIDINYKLIYNRIIKRKREVNDMDIEKLIRGLKNARRVIAALIPLALEIGTLLTVIKMIMASIR